MKEFIEELKHNREVNIEKGLENRVDIDYVIERLEDIKLEVSIEDAKTAINRRIKIYEELINNETWNSENCVSLLGLVESLKYYVNMNKSLDLLVEEKYEAD
jgi:hypothetical protein